MTQIFYPEIPDLTSNYFLFEHVGFSPLDAGDNKDFRTMGNKIVVIDPKTKNLIIDGKQFQVIDEAKLPPSVRIFFLDNYVN